MSAVPLCVRVADYANNHSTIVPGSFSKEEKSPAGFS